MLSKEGSSRYAVFDFDGTLVQSNEIKRQAFFDVVADIGGAAAVMEEILRDPDAGNRRRIFSVFLRRMSRINALRRASISDYVDRYTALCHERISLAPEVPGATYALRRLNSAGVRCFICSATRPDALFALIEARGLAEWFEAIYGSDDKAAKLQEISLKHNILLRSLVMIGDSEADRWAARVYGVQFIGVGLDDTRFARRPGVLIPDLWSLPELLLR